VESLRATIVTVLKHRTNPPTSNRRPKHAPRCAWSTTPAEASGRYEGREGKSGRSGSGPGPTRPHQRLRSRTEIRRGFRLWSGYEILETLSHGSADTVAGRRQPRARQRQSGRCRAVERRPRGHRAGRLGGSHWVV